MEQQEKPDRYILKPSAGRIVVRVESVDRKTKSGLILLSDSHAPKPTVGEVVEVCDEYEIEDQDYDPLYQKGDLVIFGKFTGTKVKVGDDEFIILQENNILGRLIPSDKPEAVSRAKVRVNAAAE